MGWLMISGVDLSAIAAAVGNDPKGDRRDIGEQAMANDGSMRATRQNRKHDFSFTSIPLSASDAFAWESLIVGDGHHWSFDSSLYSSKGLGPSANTGTTQSTSGGGKYGAGYMAVGATTGTVTFPAAANASGGTLAGWTVMVWRFESGAWHHYVVTSGGHKWLDGVRNDSAVTTWLTVSGANVTIANTTGSAVNYDDLVVLPFAVPDAWPPNLFALGAAFSDLPYLNVAGDLVTETSVRRMIGTCSVAKTVRANPTGLSGGMAKTVQVLQVDLKEA